MERLMDGWLDDDRKKNAPQMKDVPASQMDGWIMEVGS